MNVFRVFLFLFFIYWFIDLLIVFRGGGGAGAWHRSVSLNFDETDLELWDPDKTVDIFQTALQMQFLKWVFFQLQLKCHRNMFLMLKWMISHNWSRYTTERTAHNVTNDCNQNSKICKISTKPTVVTKVKYFFFFYDSLRVVCIVL